MKKLIILFLIQFCLFSYGQKPLKDLKKLEGIWIAEDYFNSFEKTHSAVLSKNAFNFGYPAGIRINTKEIKKGVMNIGYSVLHDHILHPEVSGYMIKNKDTIHEQGSFKINLKEKDSVGYYKTTDIYYFNYEWISYLKWDVKENSLTLYRPKGKKHQEEHIHYKRVKSEFKTDYLFPNPLYFYTRQNTLVGNYTIKDISGNILSENFQINEKGIANGFEKFENFTFYFSTDIYCGLPHKSDFIIIDEDTLDNNSKTFVFLIDIKENGNIYLHKRKMSEIDEYYVLGKKVFELIKN